MMNIFAFTCKLKEWVVIDHACVKNSRCQNFKSKIRLHQQSLAALFSLLQLPIASVLYN